MSMKIQTAIWDNNDQELVGSKLNVLLCLADHSNDDGVCWPSIERISQRSRISRRETQYILKELETRGYITIHREPGRSNYFIIHAQPVQSVAPVQPIAPVQPVAPHPCSPLHPPVQPIAHESSLEPSSESLFPDAAQTPPAAPVKPASIRKGKRASKPEPVAASEKAERPRDLLFDALAEVCGLDPSIKTNASQIGKAKRELTGADPPYTETHVRNFGKWWLSDDWRKRNTPIPSVPQLLQKIAQGAHYTNGDARAAPVQSADTPGQIKLRELRAKQKDRVWEA